MTRKSDSASAGQGSSGTDGSALAKTAAGPGSTAASPTRDGDLTTDGPAALPVTLEARDTLTAGPRSQPDEPAVRVPRSLLHWERYEVMELLGAGGMGAVYKARDPRLQRLVALKIVHPRLGHEAGSMGDIFLRRFIREARLQASLDHPHICKVYEIGELPISADQPGYPYISMQLIAGRPLSRAQAELSLFEKVRVIQQVAEALHAAHRQGLIHRDRRDKPSIWHRGEGNFLHPRTAVPWPLPFPHCPY